MLLPVAVRRVKPLEAWKARKHWASPALEARKREMPRRKLVV